MSVNNPELIQSNLPNVSIMPTTAIPTIVSTSTALPALQPLPKHESDEGTSIYGYIFIPIVILVLLVIVSTSIVMFMRKRRIDRLRHHLMPLYNFDGTDDDQDDWEAELLDDISESHSLRRTYKSMEFQSSTTGFSRTIS